MVNASLSNPNALSVDLRRAQASTGQSTTTGLVSSSVTSANGATTLMAQNGQLAIVASHVAAGAQSQLSLQGAQVDLSGALSGQESTREETRSATNNHIGIVRPGEGIQSRGGLQGSNDSTRLVATSLAGGSISITATGIAGSTRTVVLPDGTTRAIANPSGISLAGVTLTTPGQLALDAGTATIAFNLMQTGATTSQTQQQRDLAYQTARGAGATLNQAEYNQLSYGSLSLGGSVTVQVASNSNQRGNAAASTGPQEAVTTGSANPSSNEQTLTQLAQQPGMAWVGDVVRQQQQAALTQYWIGRVVQYSIRADTCVGGYSSALSV